MEGRGHHRATSHCSRATSHSSRATSHCSRATSHSSHATNLITMYNGYREWLQ